MSNLISTFQERFGDWLTALGQHLQLSLLTLIIAIFLSIPLAIYLSTRERASNWVLQLAGVFQTILPWPFWDSLSYYGNWNASSFNSSSHLCDIPNFAKYYYRIAWLDPSLEEAGIAFGMTKWERLRSSRFHWLCLW